MHAKEQVDWVVIKEQVENRLWKSAQGTLTRTAANSLGNLTVVTTDDI